ncbi:protein disulfide oxidoreductase [Saccharopolyspora hirsuta]|uniref:Protein disulfide oxidoreductase n=1 Tax=Saccharopolyspora hirsuta TaxID=1837 RepID=A0A5M7B7W8_SACHI|nr:NADH-ubiquinone oxidoreductase-F iron-sulfur binding region domain-containing protein [Saccharopolyspora hirsuta]KAA5825492.1 protein disulfide oxidoreductase [Saccharopolyspora hirsuta]
MGRDAFVEWERRFGRGETGLLQRLHDAVAHSGRVDREDLRTIAEEFRCPVAAVTGAAGFYADFAGAHGTRHVRICVGTSCFVSAGDHTAPLAEAALGVAPGRISADGSVSLAGAYCLGYCYASPTALDGHTPITGPDLGERLLSAEHPAAAPAVPYHVASRDAVVLAGLTEAERSWQVWPRVVTDGSPAAVRAEVALAGLRGRGGAEFPVVDKWQAAANGRSPRFVVANGDEGDPGSFCDRLLMESDPDRVLEGLALAGFATGASRGVVFVRSEYPVALARMQAAVEAARAAGHLGRGVHGSSFDFDVDVVQGAGSYVAGEETALLHALQGLRGSVRPRPPYPTESGLIGHPTAVNNVETLAAVPWVLRHGGTSYAELGNRIETGTKLVCLSQRFRHPGVYEVEFGVPLRYIVETLGGGLKPGYRLRALQVGGPLGGFLSPDDLDVPLLATALAEAGVALGHGSLVAIDDQITARELLRHVWSFAAAESCGACTPCRVGTRRGRELAARFPTSSEQILAQHEKLLDVMSTGSLCAFGRGVPAAVRSLLRVYRDELTSGDA